MAELAEKLGVDRSQVYRWVEGQVEPYKSTMIKHAQTLGYAITYKDGEFLYEQSGVKDPGAAYATSNPVYSLLRNVMIEEKDKLSQKDQAVVANYVLRVLDRLDQGA